MAYLIDRQRTLYGEDVIAMVDVRQRKTRTRVILEDNSLYHTLTRTVTLMRRAQAAVLGGMGQRMTRPHGQGAIWWTRR